MAFRKIHVEATVADTPPPPRVRAPVSLDGPDPLPEPMPTTIATYCIDAHVTPENARALHDMAKAMLKSDNETTADIKARLCSNGLIDIGECLKVVLRKAEHILTQVVGCSISQPTVYLEVPAKGDETTH